MADFLTSYEALIRLSVFMSVLGVMILLEAVFPRRARQQRRWVRWPSALAIVALNSAVLRLAFPVAATGVAVLAAGQGVGLLHQLQLPWWLEMMAAIIVLDFAIWAQHVAVHHIPLLWRFHRMHHSDVDLDAVSGIRFHPVEILVSMAYKCVVVAALGPSVAAVIAFEIILNGLAIFNHTNVLVPKWADQILRHVIVTPDVHRVHHSILAHETNSNYGFCLTWWDRLFRTYRAQPAKGHENMTLGLDFARSERAAMVDRLLLQPMLEIKPSNPEGDETI